MPILTPKNHLGPITRTSERHLGRDGLTGLDRNERISPIAEKHFQAMLASIKVEDVMAYPDAGPFVMRLARQLDVPEDFIAETAGSDAAIRRLFMAYLRPGGTVVTREPSYAMYEIYTRVFQGVARRVTYGADRCCDVDAVAAAITPDVNIVIVANPDQPCGTALTIADLRCIVAKAAEAGSICAVDEAYHPFYSVTALPLVREFENLVITRSFSKYPGCAGLRLGYAVAQPSLIKGLMAVRGGNEVSSVSLAFGCYFLDHPEIAEEFRAAVEQGRAMLCERARALGFEVLPCVTNFELLRCPSGIDPQALAEALHARGYLIKANFTHPALRDCVRVSLNGRDVMKPFVAALDDAVRTLRGAKTQAVT